MAKSFKVILFAILICVIFAYHVFATDDSKLDAVDSTTKVTSDTSGSSSTTNYPTANYPNIYKEFEIRGKDQQYYSLEEAFWFNPTVYSVDVLQFLQAYLMPDDPVNFYLAAVEFTDEQIDQFALIFENFVEPENVGAPFIYRCDLEALEALAGVEIFDRAGRYNYIYYFSTPELIQSLFPRGVGRANAYDTFRRCAIHLAAYSMKHGIPDGASAAMDYIWQLVLQFIQEQNAALESDSTSDTTQAPAVAQATGAAEVTEQAEPDAEVVENQTPAM